MEWLQWLQAHVYAVFVALGSMGLLGLLSAVITVGNALNAIDTIRSHATAFIQRLQGKPAKPDKSPTNSGDQTAQLGGTKLAKVEERASSEKSSGLDRNLDQPLLFFLVNNINNIVNTKDRDTKKRRTKHDATTRQSTQQSIGNRLDGDSLKDNNAAPAGSLPPIDVNGNVAGSVIIPSPSVGDTMPADTEPPPSIKTVPVLTPQEAQLQTHSENESVIAGPASSADGSAQPSNDTTSVANDSTVIEAEPLDQESLADAARQAAADAQAVPTSDEGAEIEVDTTTNAGMDSDIPSADADLLPLGKAVDAPEDASTQARAEEATEPPHGQASHTDQPATENRVPDSPQNANVGIAASLAEAIPVTQLTTRTYESDPPLSDEQVSDGDLAALPSAQTTETEADTVDRDIADIANSWPSPAISATLQRLRQARGLLPTDLSYDAGWITAFEAGRWHTYQSDRQRYINGIRTYLQALGMTPAELQGHLPPLLRYQNGM